MRLFILLRRQRHLEVIASSNYRRWRSILIGKSDKLETRQVRVKISNISRNIGTAIMLTAAGISTIMLPWRSNTVTRVIRRAIMETVHNGATSLDLNQAMTFRSTRVRYIRFSKAQTERSKGTRGAVRPGLSVLFHPPVWCTLHIVLPGLKSEQRRPCRR